MHIILFILIAALLIEQLGIHFLYKEFDFLIDIVGNLLGTLYYITGILAIITAVLIIYKCLKTKNFKLKAWDICFITMLAYGVFSVIFAEDKQLAIMGSHRIDGYFSYLIYASFYIGTRTLKSDRIKLWLMRALSIACTCLCMDYLFFDSKTSIFFNQNHFGYLLTMCTMLSCGLFLYEKKFWLKAVYFVLIIIQTYTLIPIDTFGSYLAVLFGIVFMIVLVFKTNKQMLYSALLVFFMFLGISIAVDSQTHILRRNFSFLSEDFEKLWSDDEAKLDAGSGRIRLWKYTLIYIKERPLFGYGPEGVYDLFYEEGLENDRPHNEYLQHALFMGIPAAILYLAGLFLLFFYALKHIKEYEPHSVIAGLAVFAYCISAFFGNTMFYTTPFFFMMLGILSKPLPAKK